MIGTQLIIYLTIFLLTLIIGIKSVEWLAYRRDSPLSKKQQFSSNVNFSPKNSSQVRIQLQPINISQNITSKSHSQSGVPIEKNYFYWINQCNTFYPLNRKEFVDFLENLYQVALNYQTENKFESSKILFIHFQRIFNQFRTKYPWYDSPNDLKNLEMYDSRISHILLTQSFSKISFSDVYPKLFADCQKALDNHSVYKYSTLIGKILSLLNTELYALEGSDQKSRLETIQSLIKIFKIRQETVKYYEILFKALKIYNSMMDALNRNNFSFAYQQLPNFKSFHLSQPQLELLLKNSNYHPLVQAIWDKYQDLKLQLTPVIQQILNETMQVSFSEKSTNDGVNDFISTLDLNYERWSQNSEKNAKN